MNNEQKDGAADLRRQLLENGFSPLPNRDKACYLEGWSKVNIDEDAIKRWGRMHGTNATGLRVQDGLCVIDIDIDHRIIEDVIEAMLLAIPEKLTPERLERMGKGHKLAWYCRTDDLFSRLHTRRWIAPGESEDDGTHSIEIFGGGSARQFGSFGPHSHDDEGKVAVMYRWAEETPEDVPLHALDVLTKDQLFAMLDAGEAELKLQGFEAVVRTKKGEGTPGREYDLTEDMVFDLVDGNSVTLEELGVMVKDGYTGRCSASWLEGETAQNRQRCLVSKSGSGHVVIWESAAGITHMAASLKPTQRNDQIDRIAEKLREKQDKRRARLNDNDDHISGAAKLMLSYAFQTSAPRAPVVPLWASPNEEPMSLINFRIQNKPYCGIEIGPRGGEREINPVDLWLKNSNRIIIAGQMMRPDRERPVFDEQGQTWVNTYRPPDLGATDGGGVDVGAQFMEQLVPDSVERQWFMRWLAHKWLKPQIPGPAIIMVARDFGTGRGTFSRLLNLLFGSRYVKDVPFKHLTGATYQSQYTDWGKDALFAIVNESAVSGEVSAYKAKHDVYEHLKEIVDPAPTERLYVSKNSASFHGISFATTLIMTNNLDAIPLPEDDRRFAVLSNGRKRDKNFWRLVNEWIDKQANIAAFAQWLEKIDLGDYDPFAVPIMTNAKRRMTSANKSEFDHAITEVIERIEGCFVLEQAVRLINEIVHRDKLELPQMWKGLLKRYLLTHCTRVRCVGSNRLLETQIKGKTYRIIYYNGDKEPDLCSEQVRRDIVTNGVIFGTENTEFGQRLNAFRGRKGSVIEND